MYHRALTRALTRSATLITLALACSAPLKAQADAAAVAPEPIQAQVQPQGLTEDFLSPDRSCRGRFPGETFARTELFFGLSRSGGVITEQEFQMFVDQFVTPQFPDGLTLLTGTGQFRDASQMIISEGSKLLISSTRGGTATPAARSSRFAPNTRTSSSNNRCCAPTMSSVSF